MNRLAIYLICLILPLLAISPKVASQEASLSGYVADSLTEETIIGAVIIINPGNKVTITDQYGYFSISGLVPGTYELSVTHLGFKKKHITVTSKSKNIILETILLEQDKLNLDAVSIIAPKPDEIADKQVDIGQKSLSPKLIQSIPKARNDVFSAIKYLPGIDKTEPLSPLYTIRGSDPGENAVLLDGVMVYNPYHSSITSGIFSTLSIKQTDLLVGGFGAEYGGRNSSVMYITTKDGNMNKLSGEIEPSTFHSKLFLEFPVGKKSSMMVAGRYYYNLPSVFLFNNNTFFYDYNLSYTLRLNTKNRISFKYFESRDFTGYNLNTLYKYLGNSFNSTIYDDFNLNQRNNWTNRVASGIHKLILTPRVYLRTQLSFSMHQSDNFSGIDIALESDETNPQSTTYQWTSSSFLKSHIYDMGAKSVFHIWVSNSNDLKLGAEYNTYYFNNQVILNSVDNGAFSRYPDLMAFFAEDKISVDLFSLRPGVRFSRYNNGNWNIEPRINLSVNINTNTRIKAAYGQYLQYIISMNASNVQMLQTVDYYYPLTESTPSKTIHYILGLEQNLAPQLLLSVDAYYKTIKSTYTFDLNQDLLNAYNFSDRLLHGSGEAYGVEFHLHGKFKKVSGWISYALAWANRKFPESDLQNGNTFPFDYNRRHTLKAILNYQITRNFAFNSSFLFLSGIHRSIETTTQNYFLYNPNEDEVNFFPLYNSSDKNSSKMPPHINLDFSIRRRLTKGFGRQLADLIKADESFVTVTIQNALFLYRNVEYYYPGTFTSIYHDKYIPLGSNYLPGVGISYTLKF